MALAVQLKVAWGSGQSISKYAPELESLNWSGILCFLQSSLERVIFLLNRAPWDVKAQDQDVGRKNLKREVCKHQQDKNRKKKKKPNPPNFKVSWFFFLFNVSFILGLRWRGAHGFCQQPLPGLVGNSEESEEGVLPSAPPSIQDLDSEQAPRCHQPKLSNTCHSAFITWSLVWLRSHLI